MLWLPKKLFPVLAKTASVIPANVEKMEHVALLREDFGGQYCVSVSQSRSYLEPISPESSVGVIVVTGWRMI